REELLFAVEWCPTSPGQAEVFRRLDLRSAQVMTEQAEVFRRLDLRSAQVMTEQAEVSRRLDLRSAQVTTEQAEVSRRLDLRSAQVTTEQAVPRCAVLGDDPAGLAAALAGAVVLGSLEELADAATAGGAGVPEAVLYTVPAGDPVPGAAWEPVVTTL